MSASKSGLAGITRQMANELAASGLNINAIAPGYMITDNTTALRADVERYLLGRIVRTVILLKGIALLRLILFGRLLSGRTEFDIPAVRLRHLTLLSVGTTNIGSDCGPKHGESDDLRGGGAEQPVHEKREPLV